MLSPHQLNRLVTPALSLHRRWGRRLWRGHDVSIRGQYHMGGPYFQSVAGIACNSWTLEQVVHCSKVLS